MLLWLKDKFLKFWKKSRNCEYLSPKECYELITNNKDEWNNYRKNNPDWIPNMDCLDFKGRDLYDVELKNCSLGNVNL